MPNRWPISSGNWSNAAIWSGSIIPTASDDVYANNQIVTIDQNITVISLNNTAASGVSPSGLFYITNGITITCNIIGGNGFSTTQISQSNSATIIGNLIGGQQRALTLSDSSNINIIGNVTAGNGSIYHGIQHFVIEKGL